jgi:hypothetical protein
MNNSVTLKFDFQTEDTDSAYSLLGVIMEKLNKIRNKIGELKYVEVNLMKPDDPHEDHKTALCRLISNDSTITEYSRAKRWEDALLNAFDKVQERFV